MKTGVLVGSIILALAVGCAPLGAAGQGGLFNASAARQAAPPATPKPDGGTVHGLDVSHYQGDVDWNAVAKAGIGFAFAKAAQGDTEGDADFAKNWQGLKDAGILRGAYDFFVVGDPPETQAQDFISRVQLEPGDLPPMVDIETENAGVESDAALVDDLHSFLDILSKHYGVRPIIYTSPGFWNAHFDDSFSDYPLWVAEYGVSAPKAVTGWSFWTLWQYSQSGKVEGVTGSVDLDKFNGSMAQLKSMTLH